MASAGAAEAFPEPAPGPGISFNDEKERRLSQVTYGLVEVGSAGTLARREIDDLSLAHRLFRGTTRAPEASFVQLVERRHPGGPGALVAEWHRSMPPLAAEAEPKAPSAPNPCPQAAHDVCCYPRCDCLARLAQADALGALVDADGPA